jgi:putative Mn2+ efflux pump MntP
MGFISIIIIAVGLSMDSFAVSVTNGMTIRRLNTKKVLLTAFSLAFFQATMPLLGWLLGIGIGNYFKQFDHWIAFVLLAIIGGKMIYEGINPDSDNEKISFSIWRLIGQSLATSIDAAAVGLTFALLDIPIIWAVAIIGIVTFIFSLIGQKIGKFLGSKISGKAEIIGGLVLVGIGIKILIEHLFFG